jgi:hypothetical protein
MSVTVELRTCRDCGESKSATDFYARPNRKRGYSSYCKPCHAARIKTGDQRRTANKREAREQQAKEQATRGTKRCSACHLEKPFAEFGPRKLGADGKQAQCRSCMRQGFIERSGSWSASREPDWATLEAPGGSDAKACIECRKQKPIGYFHRDRRSADGHAPRCKACRLAYLRDWSTGRRRSEERKTLDAIYRRFYAQVEKHPGDACWIWKGKRDHAGYGRFYVGNRFGVKDTTAAHRVAYWLEYGIEIRPDQDGRHTCDNGPGGCVRPDHVLPGTRQDNANDRMERGRTLKGRKVRPEIIQRGEQHGRHKLQESDVLRVYQMWGAGETQGVIASLLGVSRTCISLIVTGHNWSHLFHRCPRGPRQRSA